MGTNIRMIGLDLDGTTLNSESRFSERTISTFYKAMERGIEIIIATGRAEKALPNEIYEIKGLRYVATSNGARVVDIVNHNVVYENYIAEDKIDEIYTLLKERDADIEVFFDGKAHIGRREYDAIMSGEITHRNKTYIMETRIPVDGIYELLIENRNRIENININYSKGNQKVIMEPELMKIKGVELTSSVPMNNEIGGETTSKADALRFLMEKSGLKPENVLACGDNPNDLEMIRFAGIGVAMGNAEEIVKREADYVTLPNYEDGVAYAIEKFAL